jgi:hypothetical protein
LVDIVSQSPIISDIFASGVEFYSTGNIESACSSFKVCADAGSEICAFNYAYLMKNCVVKDQKSFEKSKSAISDSISEYWMYSMEHSQHPIRVTEPHRTNIRRPRTTPTLRAVSIDRTSQVGHLMANRGGGPGSEAE